MQERSRTFDVGHDGDGQVIRHGKRADDLPRARKRLEVKQSANQCSVSGFFTSYKDREIQITGKHVHKIVFFARWPMAAKIVVSWALTQSMDSSR